MGNSEQKSGVTSLNMRAIQKMVLTVVVGGFTLAACAQQTPADGSKAKAQVPVAKTTLPNRDVQVAPGTADARALDAVKRFNPGIVVENISAAPMPGFRQMIIGGQVVYVSDDGKYVLLAGQGGGLFDAGSQANLSEDALAAERVRLLKTIPQSDRIVFSPANPKYTITVFTDIECGFCRKLHSEMAEINKQGIAVEYLAFPRQGLGSKDYVDMISVWCAADRKAALTNAKTGGKVPAKDCKNTVAAQYVVGQRSGLTGTPMILAQDGKMIGGYLPPAVLKQRLDAWAAAKSKG